MSRLSTFTTRALSAQFLKPTLVLLATFAVGGAWADDPAWLVWDAGGGDDTYFTTAANWSNDAAPSADTNASREFASASMGKTVTFNTADESVGAIYVRNLWNKTDALTPVVFEAKDSNQSYGFVAARVFSAADMANSQSAFTIKSGTYKANEWSLWAYGANSSLDAKIKGGTVSLNGGIGIAEGVGGNVTSRVDVCGGTLAIEGGDMLIGLNSDADSLAEISVSNGGVISCGENVEKWIALGHGGSYAGTVNFNIDAGGTLKAWRIEKRSSTTTTKAKINFNGGTLAALGENEIIGAGIDVVIGSNGGTIDTNGKEVTVASVITGDGTLYVKGGGKVTFTATPTCTVVVEGDTTAVDSSDNAIGIVQNTWRGASGAYWNVDSNWSAGSVPTADQIVKIDTDGTILISGWLDTDADACKAGALVIDANVVFSSTFKRPFIYGISGMTAISGSGTLTLTDNTGLENYSASVQEITCGLTFGTNSDHSWLGGSTYGWKVSGATTINSTVQTDQSAEFAGPMTIGENGVINTTGKAVTVTATSVVGSVLTFTGTGAVSIPISGSNVTIPAITTGGDLTVRGNGNVMVSGNISIAGVLTVSDVTLDAIGYNITASAVNLSASQIEGGHAGTVPAQTCVKANMIDAKVRGSGSVVTSGSVAAYGAGNFVGNIAANSLVKTDNGELVLFGTNAISGNITIGAGSMKLGDPLSLGTILYDFDVSAENAIETDENGAFLYVKAVNDNTMHLTSSGDEVPSIITDDQTSFGKRTYLKGNKLKLQAPTTGSGSTPTLLTTFLVWRVDSATDNYTTAMGNSYSGYSKYQIRCHNNKTKFVWRSYGGNDNWWDNNNCIWSNGQSGAPLIYTEQLMTVCGDEWLLRAYHPGYYGSSSKCSFAEVIGFNTKFTLDQRKAIEDYLMAKWGVNQTEYEVLSRSANILMSNETALDLGGLTQTVNSVSLSGLGTATVRNGKLTITQPISLASGQTLKLPEFSTYTLADGSNIRATTADGVITLTTLAPAYVGDTPFQTVQAAIDAIVAGTATGTLTIHESASVNLSTTAASITDVVLDDGVTLTFTANLPWQASYSDGTIVNQRVASSYVWTPQNNSTDWATLGNWRIDGEAGTALPGENDTVIFPTTETGWNVTIPDNQVVATVQFNGKTTLSGALIKAGEISASAEVSLGNGAGFMDKTLENISLKIIADNEDTPARIYYRDSQPVLKSTCVITGTGILSFECEYDKGTSAGISIQARMTDFAGKVILSRASQGNHRDNAQLYSQSSSKLATWKFNSNHRQKSPFLRSNSTYSFGSVSGSFDHNWDGLSNESAGYAYVVEIGYLNNTDDNLGGTFYWVGQSVSGVHSGSCQQLKEEKYQPVVRKIGTGKLTFTGKLVGRYEIENGVLLLDSNETLQSFWEPNGYYVSALQNEGAEYYPPIKFTGNSTLALGDSVTVDPTYHNQIVVAQGVSFAISNATDRTFANAIGSGTTGGFTKKGAGTLTLSQPPTYTGTTTVEAGTLVIDGEFNTSSTAIAPGATLKVLTPSGTTPTVSVDGLYEVAVATDGDYTVYTVVASAESIAVDGAPANIVVDVDDLASVGITVGMTDDQKSDKLEATAANGLAVWQNYVMNIEGNATQKFAAVVTPTTDATMTVATSFGSTAGRTGAGVKVTYKLMKKSGETWEQVGNASTTPSFSVDPSMLDANARLKIQAVFAE